MSALPPLDMAALAAPFLSPEKPAGEGPSFYSRGWEAGRRWAQEQARLTQTTALRRALTTTAPEERPRWFRAQPGSPYTAFERLYFAMEPDHRGDRQAAEDFWEAAVGEDWYPEALRPSFLAGFVTGALEGQG